MTQISTNVRYIYAATNKETGEFVGYWKKDPAFSLIALTPSVWNAEFTASIKFARDVLNSLRINVPTYNWKIQEVTISAPKDVE